MTTKIDNNAPAAPSNDLPLAAPPKSAPAKAQLSLEPELVAPPFARKVPDSDGKAPLSAKEAPAALRHIANQTKQLAKLATRQPPGRRSFAEHVTAFDATVKEASRVLAAHPELAAKIVPDACHLQAVADSTLSASSATPVTVESKARGAALAHLGRLLSDLERAQPKDGRVKAAASDTRQSINEFQSAAEQGRRDASFYAATISGLADTFAKFKVADGVDSPEDFAQLAQDAAASAQAPPFAAQMLGDLAHALLKQSATALSEWHDNYNARLDDAPVHDEEQAALKSLIEKVPTDIVLSLLAPRRHG